MSDVDNEFDDDATETQSKGNALRQQNSKLASEKKALEEQLAQLIEKDRARTIADVLRDKQANPKLAKYVARDVEGDVTAEAVEKWLEEEGELFGYNKPDAEEDPDAEQAARISQASSQAPQPQTGWTPERIRNATPQQLIEAGLLDP